MKKLSVRQLSIVSCVSAVLAFAPLAHADSVLGFAYEGGTTNSVPSIPSPGSATSSFILSNTLGGPLFNSYAQTNSASAYTLGGFLTTTGSAGFPASPNGDTVTFLTGSSHATDSLNNYLLVFYGNVTLKSGVTYTITHDDGVVLYLNGSSTPTINAPNPTNSETSTFSVGTTETVPFVLEYAEVDGAPAELKGLGLSAITAGAPTPTPEPSSFVLLGSGLLAAAGMVRRRMLA